MIEVKRTALAMNLELSYEAARLLEIQLEQRFGDAILTLNVSGKYVVETTVCNPETLLCMIWFVRGWCRSQQVKVKSTMGVMKSYEETTPEDIVAQEVSAQEVTKIVRKKILEIGSALHIFEGRITMGDDEMMTVDVSGSDKFLAHLYFLDIVNAQFKVKLTVEIIPLWEQDEAVKSNESD